MIFILLIVTCSAAHLGSFDRQAVVEIFENYRPTYFVFTDSEELLQKYTAIAAADEEIFTQESMFFCFPKAEDEGYENLVQYLGVVNRSDQITLYLPYNKKYRYVEEFKTDNLLAFKKLAEDGEVEEYLNSETLSYEGQKGVIQLMGKTLEEYFEPFQEQEVVVLLYTRESQSCKPVEEVMGKLADDLSSNANLLFGKLDVSRNEIGMWQKYLTVTIPMIVFWQRDKNIAPFVYQQPFQYESIKNWIREKTLYEWVQNASAEETIRQQQPAESATPPSNDL